MEKEIDTHHLQLEVGKKETAGNESTVPNRNQKDFSIRNGKTLRN